MTYRKTALDIDVEGNSVKVFFEAVDDNYFWIIEELSGTGIEEIFGSSFRKSVLVIETNPWTVSMDKNLLGPLCLVWVDQCAKVSPFLIMKGLPIKIKEGGLKFWMGEIKQLESRELPLNEDIENLKNAIDTKIYQEKWEKNGGIESTSIWLDFGEDGSIELSGQDMGPTVEKFKFDDDWEYWIKISPGDIKKFITLIFKEAFNSENKLRFSTVQKICEENNIETNYGNY